MPFGSRRQGGDVRAAGPGGSQAVPAATIAVAYLHAGFDLDQSVRTFIEAVHRLSDLGAVYTHAGHGVSHAGFDAEWRGIDIMTVDGDLINLSEVFDEADLDTALVRFDELVPAPHGEDARGHIP